MSGECILVVDDEPAVRAFLRRVLSARGYRVREAADGEEGLARAAQEPPDLVLVDLMMPRLDGYGVCRVLKSDPRTRFVPVIVCTTLEDLPEKLRALELGADEFLNKPVNVAELTVRVRALLSLKARTDELEQAAFVLDAIARIVDRRDPYTAAHSTRVTDLAVRLGGALGIAGTRLETLRLGASLHDVGKIAVRDAVLMKAGRLTPEEYAIVQTHPVAGEEICRRMKSIAPALPLIRHHHERLDGSGYPDGLAGDEIPIDVRVLSVADVYDALTTTRSYRAAFTAEAALDILRDEAVRGLWDREIVEVHAAMVAPATGVSRAT